MWDIIYIIWPTCNDHFSERVKEWVILDEGLKLSFSFRRDVYMVDGDVYRCLWSFERCLVRERISNQHLSARSILDGDIIVLE